MNEKTQSETGGGMLRPAAEPQTEIRASIDRTRPLWCSGWLDTVPVEADENGQPIINIEDLREMYGGEKYFIRFIDPRGKYIGGTTINLRGIPPKLDGVPLLTPEQKAEQEKAEKRAELEAQKRERENDSMLKFLIEQQRLAAENQIAMMREQLSKKDDPLSTVAPILSMFKALESFRGPQTSDQGVAGLLQGVMEAFAKIPGGPMTATNPGSPPPPARALPPVPVPVPVSARAAAPVESTPVVNTVENLQNVDLKSTKNSIQDCQEQNSEYDQTLSEELADLNDDELSAVIVDAIGRIGEQRAIALFQRIAGSAAPDPIDHNPAS